MGELAIIFAAFVDGMQIVFTVTVFSAMMIGIIAGMIVGLIPGLGGLVAHILLIPFALQMGDPLAAIAMLLGVYAVTVQTDSIPAVMLGVPGTAAALATSLDGYPMSKRGEAGRALSASYFGSIFGTLVATVMFILFLPLLRALVTKFSSPEFFMMVVLGLIMAATLSGRSQARGLLMAGLGLILSTVGQAPGTGDPRARTGRLIGELRLPPVGRDGGLLGGLLDHHQAGEGGVRRRRHLDSLSATGHPLPRCHRGK